MRGKIGHLPSPELALTGNLVELPHLNIATHMLGANEGGTPLQQLQHKRERGPSRHILPVI